MVLLFRAFWGWWRKLTWPFRVMFTGSAFIVVYGLALPHLPRQWGLVEAGVLFVWGVVMAAVISRVLRDVPGGEPRPGPGEDRDA